MKEIPNFLTSLVNGGSLEAYASFLVFPIAGISAVSLGLIIEKIVERSGSGLPSGIGYMGGAAIGFFGTLLTADYLGSIQSEQPKLSSAFASEENNI